MAETKEERIFNINGKKFIRSKEKLRDGDEVYCICIHKDSKIPYGTKGHIVSMQWDRVSFLDQEFVIWHDQTAKLIEL